MELRQELETIATCGAYQLLEQCPNQRMKNVANLVRKNSQTNATVNIYGETGAGKEIIARALHEQSPRSKHRLIVVNCGNQDQGMMRSELFGHEKGSFTGAFKQHYGAFEVADKGTIFLDEIGEIPLELQPRLLRVLEDRSFSRIGSTEVIQSDFRVIAGTNRNLWNMVQDGKFRSDVYYRLNVVPIMIPPLRERSEDIGYLARKFLAEFSHGEIVLSDEAVAALEKYSWPGNVRELRNVLERAAIMLYNEQKILLPEHLSFVPEGPAENKRIQEMNIRACVRKLCELTPGHTLEIVEEHLIRETIKMNDGGIEISARQLGVNSATLYRKLRNCPDLGGKVSNIVAGSV